jgi:hypothetical protein
MLEGLGPRAVARLERALDSENEMVAMAAAKEVLSRVAPVPKNGTLAVSVEHGPNSHLAALVGLAINTAARVQLAPGNDAQVIDSKDYVSFDAQKERAPETADASERDTQ